MKLLLEISKQHLTVSDKKGSSSGNLQKEEKKRALILEEKMRNGSTGRGTAEDQLRRSLYFFNEIQDLCG